MSKKQNTTIYIREIIFVQAHPRNVRRFVCGSELMGSQPWMLSSVVGAIQQTSPDGKVSIVARDDGPFFDFQPGELALAELQPDGASVVRLDGDAFDELALAYTAGMNNLNALARVIPIIEKHAPSLRFMPRHLHHLVKPEDDMSEYRHLPRMFMRYDFTGYEALMWVAKHGGQISPKQYDKLRMNAESVMHVGGAWYAFRSLEDAVMTKFMAPESEIHRIAEDG